MKPRLLDLFCGAGGAGMGYALAGFEVVGVDIKPQPRYPFQFVQADALLYAARYGHLFDAIHASPPCQFASRIINPQKGRDPKHTNWIPATRIVLQRIGKPYAIENVPGAKEHLYDPLKLSGSMFGLSIFRDRYFETKPAIYFTAMPRYDFVPVVVNGSSKQGHPRIEAMKKAMDIHWMTKDELRQAIPPAYTQYIGGYLLAAINRK